MKWEFIITLIIMGSVYINEKQYFENVQLSVWEFYIGGYQLAQKWLKDRKERELSYEDILRYQKIIVALTEAERIMKEIDKLDIESYCPPYCPHEKTKALQSFRLQRFIV